MSMGTKEAGDPCYFRREQLRCHCYGEVRQIHEMPRTWRVSDLSPEDAKDHHTFARIDPKARSSRTEGDT